MNGYYTSETENPEVYHILRYCPAGEQIKKPNRVKAKVPVSGRRACDDCQELARKWLFSLPKP